VSHRLLTPLHDAAAPGVTAPVRVAAAWSWRLIIVLAAVGLSGYLVSTVTVVIIPVLIAGPLAGLVLPPVRWLRSRRVPTAVAAVVTVVIGSVVGLLVPAGRQSVLGFARLSGSVRTGMVIPVFTLLLLLLDGERSWLFVVRLFPVPARRAVDGAGRRGWHALAPQAEPASCHR
jgi:predicted PurR-regulated permease PerM